MGQFPCHLARAMATRSTRFGTMLYFPGGPGKPRSPHVELSKLFDLSRWFNPFPEPPGILYLVALVAFGLWTIASIAVYLYRRRLFAGNGALVGIVTRFGPYGITIGGIGMFLLVMRFVGIPYISIRFL